jgi:hypothetical protein
MRCTPCHGTGVCNHEPCPECGGYGQVSCCERFDPEASADVPPPGPRQAAYDHLESMCSLYAMDCTAPINRAPSEFWQTDRKTDTVYVGYEGWDMQTK